jgi:CxxC motif-containing protein (DUF1111 family)
MIAFSIAFSTGCSGGSQPMTVAEDRTSAAIAGLSADDLARHRRGDALFEQTFRPSQGLGPLYIRASCSSCHSSDMRGPGAVQRMSVVEADGFTRAADQSLLPFGTVVRPQLAAGATHGILPPENEPSVKLSLRVGPATYGRAYLDAVDDRTLLDLAETQMREGVVSGRANVLDDGHVGRFGVKARLATIAAFVADAFRGDMGMTSPQVPDELPNPDGLHDDLFPGVDLPASTVDDVAFYVQTLAMPTRTGLTDAGVSLFASTGCASCHAPSLHTRADYPVAAVADVDAPIFSDLLLHDMGAQLADGIVDGSATEREWRTPPLMGLRFSTSFLHDGRAETIEQAITMHRGDGSEANFAVDRFEALDDADRAALLDYLAHL